MVQERGTPNRESLSLPFYVTVTGSALCGYSGDKAERNALTILVQVDIAGAPPSSNDFVNDSRHSTARQRKQIDARSHRSP